MKKLTNFQKICNLAMDSDEDIANEFSLTEKNCINHGINNKGNDVNYVVWAKDKMFSGWGRSKDMTNNVFVICWSHSQAIAILNSLKHCECMVNPRMVTLDFFCSMRHYSKSTWSLKNANNCTAWNDGYIVEV